MQRPAAPYIIAVLALASWACSGPEPPAPDMGNDQGLVLEGKVAPSGEMRSASGRYKLRGRLSPTSPQPARGGTLELKAKPFPARVLPRQDGVSSPRDDREGPRDP